MNLELFTITFLPSLIIIFYIVYSDKFREPALAVIKTLIIGFLITIPAAYFNKLIIFDAGRSALFAGLTEETLKYFILFFYIGKQKYFDEPMDALVYGVLISMGFASYENYTYVLQAIQGSKDSYSVSLIRAFTAVPMHAICGVIMGYFFGYANFIKRKNNLAKALFFPMTIHACYNFLVETVSIFFVFFYLIIIFKYANYLHIKFKEMQKLKIKEHEEKII
jgi:RsiW-degrading membrane proteinase PrsW (M82 family)